MDQLFKQTVHQDGQRGEADVVQCQINTVVQRLNGAASRFQLTSDNPVRLPAKRNCQLSAIINGFQVRCIAYKGMLKFNKKL